MATTTYATKQDFITFEIAHVLGEYADQHDLDAIFDETSEWTEFPGEAQRNGYVVREDVDFWAIVAKHAKDSE